MLRVNWMVWLILLYMTRHTLLVIFLLFASSRGGLTGMGDVFGVGGLFEPLYMIADIPALALLFALGARIPQAGSVARLVWRNGKRIVLASIAIYFAAFFWKQGLDVASFETAIQVNIALNLVIAGLVTYSRYLRDLFGQFPSPAD